MDEQRDIAVPVTIFYSYAHEDEKFRLLLEEHLSLLRQQGVISGWHDRQIMAGTDWKQAVDAHLSAASVILLLISAHFLNSDYCYGVEMQYALARHEAGTARVIPIILQPVDWEHAPFAHLQCLPRNGKPITKWKNRQAAFREVAIEIRAVIEKMAPPSSTLLHPSLSTNALLSPPHSDMGSSNSSGILAPPMGNQEGFLHSLDGLREKIVADPINGARALSDYLASFPQWQAKRVEIDLKRAQLERIQRDSAVFPLSSDEKAEKWRAVFFLLETCIALEREGLR